MREGRNAHTVAVASIRKIYTTLLMSPDATTLAAFAIAGLGPVFLLSDGR